MIYRKTYQHHSVVDVVIGRLPSGQQSAVIDIMGQPKTSQSQKRALLLKRGLLRSTADELELFAEIGRLVFTVLLLDTDDLQMRISMGSSPRLRRCRQPSSI
jgi:hypothetical protein